jgi:hypothetical protein
MQGAVLLSDICNLKLTATQSASFLFHQSHLLVGIVDINVETRRSDEVGHLSIRERLELVGRIRRHTKRDNIIPVAISLKFDRVVASMSGLDDVRD